MKKRKENNYKFWHSPLALILLFFLFIFFGFKIINLLEKERETSNKKELILDEIDELKKKKIDISNNLSKLETEEGQEEIIRSKYQVAKTGEKMLIIVDEEAGPDSQRGEEKLEHGFWNWIKKLFNK